MAQLYIMIGVPFFFFLTAGISQGVQVHQSPSAVIKNASDDVHLFCTHGKSDYRVMLWYQQLPGDKALKLIGYGYTEFKKNESVEEPFRKHFKLAGDLKSDKKNGSLSISKLKALEHTATYFCAASQQGTNNYPAYFGQGTKLTVIDSNTAITPPTVKILKPSEKECKSKKEKKKKKTLVCVAKNFYPDHVSVFWQISGEDQTNGVATDEAAQKIGSYYRITSRLRVSAKEWFTPGNNFTCVVRFFDGTVTTNYEAITVNEKAHKIVKTSREKYLSITHNAILTYGVLIAKSCAYGAFAGFLVWKLQSSAKKHH